MNIRRVSHSAVQNIVYNRKGLPQMTAPSPCQKRKSSNRSRKGNRRCLSGAENKDKSEPHHRGLKFGFLLPPPDFGVPTLSVELV